MNRMTTMDTARARNSLRRGTDASLMNEVLAYRLYRDAGVPAPRTAYTRVFVTVPGQHDRKYFGLYSMTEADDATFAARIGEFIDLPGFARFMAVMVYLSDLDGILGPGQNLYLHLHPKSPHVRFIPWDQDRSWGQFNRASQEQRDKLSIHRPWQGENFFLERMFKVETFSSAELRGGSRVLLRLDPAPPPETICLRPNASPFLSRGTESSFRE